MSWLVPVAIACVDVCAEHGSAKEPAKGKSGFGWNQLESQFNTLLSTGDAGCLFYRPLVESELSAHALGCVLLDCRATCGTARGVADAPKAGDADAGSADERAQLDRRVSELAGEMERVRAERDGAWGLCARGWRVV